MQRRLHIYLWYGGTIIPESHALFALCCPEIIQSCEELVSPHYYSCRLQGTFFITGVFGDLMKISFQSAISSCDFQFLFSWNRMRIFIVFFYWRICRNV